jgi:flavin reductase (DIM6/NTAB) family NADH-FMN oxidoreductase RutF
LPNTAPDAPASTTAFRQLMGQFATGVAVVSFAAGEGAISAMTINSLVSVSLDPMLVCWNLQHSSSQYAAYAGAERFAISILAESQQALARRYAARGDTARLLEDFETGADGLPVIRGALGHVACRRFAVHPAGDHTLILGEVTGMAQGAAGGRPLLFFGGRFGELAG